MVQQYMQNETTDAKINPHQRYWQQQHRARESSICNTILYYIHTYIHVRLLVQY